MKIIGYIFKLLSIVVAVVALDIHFVNYFADKVWLVYVERYWLVSNLIAFLFSGFTIFTLILLLIGYHVNKKEIDEKSKINLKKDINPLNLSRSLFVNVVTLILTTNYFTLSLCVSNIIMFLLVVLLVNLIVNIKYENN